MRFSISYYIMRPSRKKILQDLQYAARDLKGSTADIKRLNEQIEKLTAELNAVRKMLEKEQEAHADTRGRFQKHRNSLAIRLKAISSVFCGTSKAKPADVETGTPAENENTEVGVIGYEAPRSIVPREPFRPVVFDEPADNPICNTVIGAAAKVIPGSGNVAGM